MAPLPRHHHLRAVFAAAVLCLSLALQHAQADVAVTVDMTSAGTAFPHYWKRCVGSGHALLGTRADWQQHLRIARDKLGFTGIRFHGIFDDDMSTAPGGAYHFYNVDVVYDFLLSIGVRPIVELSFMPLSLAKCKPADCEYAFDDHGGYKGLVMPPADYNDWFKLVNAFATHLVGRYGLAEVSSWSFEVWNEMWGIEYPSEYMQLYNASALAVKAVSAQLKVGGPATMQVLDVADFIQRCQAQKLPLDFVSTHFYPSDPQCPTAQGEDCFANTVLAARNAAASQGLPFFLTEYNDGLWDGNHRDTAYAAAFVFHNIPKMQSLDVFSWWTFTDIFEEQWMVADPFYNGFGMLTKQGVPKPVFRAFEQLNGAGDTQLPVQVSGASDNDSVVVFATVSSEGSKPTKDLQIFISNFVPLTFPAPPVQTLVITVPYTPASGVKLPDTAYAARISDTTVKPWGLWDSWARPSYLTPEQIDLLEQASVVPQEAVNVDLSVAGQAKLQIQVAASETIHITF